MDHTPILMIPGLNATPRAFAAQLETLWRHGPVTIADQKQGSSMREIAAAILRDAPPSFVLGGFSMGGYVALEIMRQAPERVKALILIDTQARPDTPEASENRRRGIELARAGRLEAASMATYPNAFHPSNIDNPEMRAIHLEMALATGPEAYIREQESIIGRPDSSPDLGRIKVPTLIIVGDSDKITPPEAARELAAGIPRSRLVVIERAGHYALVEQPEQVNAAIEAFLAG